MSEMVWVSCSKEADVMTARYRHLIHKGSYTTACNASANHLSIWRGNSTKPPCPKCSQKTDTPVDAMSLT